MTRDRLRSGAIVGLVALVGCFVAAATYKLTAPATGADEAAAAVAAKAPATPGPAAFGRTFVGAMNGYAESQGDARRLADPHCVRASPGHYMCSYALVAPSGKRECHVMQALWTPPNPVKVTRAGRVGRCETLRAALKSLR